METTLIVICVLLLIAIVLIIVFKKQKQQRIATATKPKVVELPTSLSKVKPTQQKRLSH